MELDLSIIAAIAALLAVLFLACLWLLSANTKHRKTISDQQNELVRFQGVADADTERQRIIADIQRLRSEQAVAVQQGQLQKTLDEARLYDQRLSFEKLRLEMQALDEDINLYSFGFYKARYDFINSEQYLAALEAVRQGQKALLTQGRAAVCQIEWQVNGSKTEGKKQTDRTIKLVLRAFNGDCDAAIAKVRYNNVHVMEARIRKSYETVNKMAEIQQVQIVFDYLNLKLQELYLAHEYQEKVQQEKEEQRQLREQMREEEAARRDMERAIAEAASEEARQAEALRKAYEIAGKASGERQQVLLAQVEELKRRLAEAQDRKTRALSMAQMTKSGHVYVISNVGSFGENVFKIGMTRRLDPLDRVRELGDASVPFLFDVHAVIFSEDAPALEATLHRAFHHRRVNAINERKEFFCVSIEEIAQVVHRCHGQIEITQAAEAAEFRKTLAMRKDAPPQIAGSGASSRRQPAAFA
jgi:hypothetical protein